jgi:uncharacterized membrane protein
VLVLAVLPPFVGPAAQAALGRAFDLVCHQLPARSFTVDGVPFALCHRCTGVVAGLAAGALLVPLLGWWRAPLVPYERPLLLAALSLAGADWLLGAVGLWADPPAARVLTGALVGLSAGYLLARSAACPEAVPPTSGRIPSVAAS